MPHFDWQSNPAGQQIIDDLVHATVEACEPLAALADRMVHETGTRLDCWLDFVEAPVDAALEQKLTETGFEPASFEGAQRAWEHPGAVFPPVLDRGDGKRRVGIRVDSVADFAAAHVIPNARPIHGVPWGPVRFLSAWEEGDAELIAVERHGYRGFKPGADAQRTVASLHHLETFRRRERRKGRGDERAFDWVDRLVGNAVRDIGVDAACDLFFRAEREFWQRRNRAANVQKSRQDTLGLGWANHDHHTYRSSRRWFGRVVNTLELLGFRKRERFYAGAEAGWGAQVLEQPTCGIVIFADVDMSPEEIDGDFSIQGFEERGELGTIGLWCALHGESMLTAGMHHLECQFDFESVRDQLAGYGVRTMTPFTDMPVLRQAFTEGERWEVDPLRIRDLRQENLISAVQADGFLTNGAVGSHMEILERRQGYKGFNQKGVSDIISRTDPRGLHAPIQA